MRLFSLLFLSQFSGFLSLSAQSGPATDGDLRRDIAALREAVIQQTRQIDALTGEVERLGIAMGQRRPTIVTPPPAPTAVAPGEPVVDASKTSSTPASSPVIPAATPLPNTLQHTVAKGDNLTNIAKKYGTTIDAIQKLNKISDVRKMQVGQVLNIPLPVTKLPAASPSSPTPSSSPTP